MRRVSIASMAFGLASTMFTSEDRPSVYLMVGILLARRVVTGSMLFRAFRRISKRRSIY